MIRTFIRLPEFEKRCKRLDLSEDDIVDIENCLLENPAVGDIVKGTGGVRKFRFALHDDKGKSGGARIIYVDFAYYEKIYLLSVFAKDEQENLTQTERNDLKDLVKVLEAEARERRRI